MLIRKLGLSIGDDSLLVPAAVLRRIGEELRVTVADVVSSIPHPVR